MYFTSWLETIAVGILWLTSTPRPHVHHPPDYSIVRDDLHCSDGFLPTFLHNSYTYDAPLHKFTDITKSFFNITWYGDAAVSRTTGTDNVPGATRGGAFGGGPFNETLTMYLARPDAVSYTIHGERWDYAPPNLPPLHLASYAETKRFESICGGRATYINLITYLCSDDPPAAYSLFYTVHMETVQRLARTVGAKVLAGDCPVLVDSPIAVTGK
ncbi:hypothetical protein DFH09DRAFT_1284116 [Mycena vulgaris]|nr:hypothetical protein DFH09DRAFT_1284116 [Mycena vulgaris]